jgi:hypothetical protein
MAKQVPIVFVRVGDPAGSGFVAGLAHPGGTITGFAGWGHSQPRSFWPVLRRWNWTG